MSAPAKLQSLADDLSLLLKDNIEPSNPKFNKLLKEVKQLSSDDDPDSIAILKEICDNINEVLIKKVAHTLICITVMSVNAGKITNSERIRLLCSMFPRISIFCFSEVMWPREEALRKTNWPQDHDIYTHDILGSSRDSYSLIVVNNQKVRNVSQLPSVGTFTVLKIKDSSTTAILCAGYRFCDKPLSKCWYNKYIKASPLKFCEWVEEITDLYEKPCFKLFITGDFNTHDVPRPADPKAIASRLSNCLRRLVNIVTFPTFFRNNSRSSIDKVWCSDPTRTRIKYLNLHQPPFGFDGHRGLSFEIPITESHIPFELFVSSTLASRSEVFSSALATEKEAPSLSCFEDHFDLLTSILDKNTTRKVRIKRPPNRNDFNYSSVTWNFINYLNDLKDKIRAKDPKLFDKPLYKRTLSILTAKIGKLKKLDEKRYRNDVSHRLSKNKNEIWDLLSHITAPPPPEKISDDENTLVDRVLELQTKTIKEVDVFDGPPVTLQCTKKLESLPITFNPTSDTMPSFYSEFLGLADITRGAAGLSKSFLDALPSSFIMDHLFDPIRSTMTAGEFPKCLRLSRVTVLSKGGGGIRPISINSPVGSILEKLIVFYLTPFLELNNLIPEAQSGFRTGLGCSTSLFQVVNGIARAYDRGKCVMAIMIDVRNAFGCIPHKSLIKLLEKVSKGPALSILSQSLERWIRVHKNGFISKTLPLREYGIPQGGLSPPYFSVISCPRLTII
jgi:hypothetical protein